MKSELKIIVKLPQQVKAQLVDETTVVIKGPKGEVQRDFLHPQVQLAVEPLEIVLTSKKSSKNEKKVMCAFEAHLENMIRGVQEPFIYTLKICSGHFPMSVSVSGQEFIVKNFLGETVPRKVSFSPKVEVKISGTEITVRSPDRELAGQTAAKIESLCRITNRDRRVFQDGCYIVAKPSKNFV